MSINYKTQYKYSSFESFLLDFGLINRCLLKFFFANSTTSWFPTPEKVLIRITPFFFKHSNEKFITSIAIILLLIESNDRLPVEFSAISDKTISNLLPFINSINFS